MIKILSEKLKNIVFKKKNKLKVKIEKNMCRNVFKPNTLKSESEIEENTEKLIFPYLVIDGEFDLFEKVRRTLRIID